MDQKRQAFGRALPLRPIETPAFWYACHLPWILFPEPVQLGLQLCDMSGYYVLISPAGEAPALQDFLHHRQLGIGEHDAGIARIDPLRTAVATFVITTQVECSLRARIGFDPNNKHCLLLGLLLPRLYLSHRHVSAGKHARQILRQILYLQTVNQGC